MNGSPSSSLGENMVCAGGEENADTCQVCPNLGLNLVSQYMGKIWCPNLWLNLVSQYMGKIWCPNL